MRSLCATDVPSSCQVTTERLLTIKLTTHTFPRIRFKPVYPL